jgi:hypothetical protein
MRAAQVQVIENVEGVAFPGKKGSAKVGVKSKVEERNQTSQVL